jgi:hypothetical protein
MVAWQVPPAPILVHCQTVSAGDMLPEHLALPAAVHADDIIRRHRSAERHCGRALGDGFLRRLAETGERVVHRADQRGHRFDADLVVPEIGRDGFRSALAVGV